MARRLEWLVLIAAALVAWPVFNSRGAARRPGDTIDADITLITSDRQQLSCASRKSFGKYRCEFPAPKRTWPMPPPPDQQLAPYSTLDGQLFLIPDLFEQPALALRYAQEPPAHVPTRRLRRFVARCKLRLVRAAHAVQVRWLRRDRWGAAPDGWVAEPVACKVDD